MKEDDKNILLAIVDCLRDQNTRELRFNSYHKSLEIKLQQVSTDGSIWSFCHSFDDLELSFGSKAVVDVIRVMTAKANIDRDDTK